MRNPFTLRKKIPAQDNSALFAKYYADYVTRTYPSSKNPTYLAVVNGIASTFASLDWRLDRNVRGARVQSYNHPLAYLLKHPNTHDTQTQFFYRLAYTYLDKGEVFLFKTRASDGNVNNINILANSEMRVVQSERPPFDKTFFYRGVPYTSEEILHIYNPQFYDGVNGHPVLNYCSSTIDLDTSLLAYVDNYFRQSIGNKILFEFEAGTVEGLADPSLKDAMKAWIQSNVIDPASQGSPGIIPPGTKLHEVTQTSNAESDIASLKERTERDICKIFNYPYYKISGEYGNNLESQQISYLQDCILPMTDIFVEAFNLLVLPSEPFIEFHVSYDNLIMPDTNTRVKKVIDSIRGGIMSINEGRNELGYDSVSTSKVASAADALWYMSNLIPAMDENLPAYFAKAKAIGESSLGTKASTDPETPPLNDAVQ